MLTVNSLAKSFGLETIFKDVSFNLNEGERLGLVGPNGSGKTTLIRILAGVDQADAGSVSLTPSSLRIGYLPQGFEYAENETMGDFLARMQGDLPGLTRRLEQLASILAQSNNLELQREYDSTLAQIDAAAQSAERGLPVILANLGLEHIPLERPAAKLSGGQKTRLALAGLLLSHPHLLLLDEPTNHLDIAMLEWFEDWLAGFRHAALIVSHDRVFLDHTTTGILELDAQTHTLRQYEGNYSTYLEQKAAEHEKHWQQYQDQQDEITQLRSAAAHLRGIAGFRRGGKGDSGDKFAKGFFGNRARATVGKAKHIERRINKILTDDAVEKPRLVWEMKVEFDQVQPTGRDVLVLQDLTLGYGENILLKDVNQTLRFGERLALIGPNGCGKTTLVRAIMGSIEPLSGSLRIGSNVRTGYMAQEQEDLDARLNPLETVQRLAAMNETDARSFLSKYLFKGDDVFVPVGKLSFGERVRLSLACFVAGGCNFLVLDEPVNHLDISARGRFEQALAQFEGTILAVVHDRYFIESYASAIWEVVDRQIIRRSGATNTSHQK